MHLVQLAQNFPVSQSGDAGEDFTKPALQKSLADL